MINTVLNNSAISVEKILNKTEKKVPSLGLLIVGGYSNKYWSLMQSAMILGQF
jgi:hypothetical protein